MRKKNISSVLESPMQQVPPQVVKEELSGLIIVPDG